MILFFSGYQNNWAVKEFERRCRMDTMETYWNCKVKNKPSTVLTLMIEDRQRRLDEDAAKQQPKRNKKGRKT